MKDQILISVLDCMPFNYEAKYILTFYFKEKKNPFWLRRTLLKDRKHIIKIWEKY